MSVTAEVSQVEMSPYVDVAVIGSLSQAATAVPMLLDVIAVTDALSEKSKERILSRSLRAKKSKNKRTKAEIYFKVFSEIRRPTTTA